MKGDIIICGIKGDDPNETEEMLIESVIDIVKKLKVKLEPQEVTAIQRLPTTKEN